MGIILSRTHVINAPREIKLFSKEQEKLFLAYRFDGKSSSDYKYVWMIDQLLSNSGKSGIFDTYLNESGKILGVSSSLLFLKDYGVHYISGLPKEGQSLDSLKILILEEIEKLKQGEFGEWLLEAIVNNLKLKRISALDNNINRASAILYSELYGVPYQDYVAFTDELSKITKENVMKFANEHYRNNYVIVSKLKGEKDLLRVEKPAITPLEINRDNQSTFAHTFMKYEPSNLQPLFIDYKKEFPGTTLKNGMQFYHQTDNKGTFTLRYIFPVGSHHDNLLPFAIYYFNKLGTPKFSPDSLKKELFKYGLSINLSPANDKSYLNVSGLNEHFDKALELINIMFGEVMNDPQIYNKLLTTEEGSRKLSKENKRNITFHGQQYVLFGPDNSFTNSPSMETLTNQEPQELLNKIKHLFNHNFVIYYSGDQTKDSVIAKITKTQNLPSQFATVPPKKEFKYRPLNKPMVYLLDYDMVQAQLNTIIKDVPYSADLLANKELYEAYYGRGMSSIIFQEIREAKALAYSSGSYYRMEPTNLSSINI